MLTFSFQRFAGSDDDTGSYTSLSSYSTPTTFYEVLLPSATQLNYWGSDNTENRTSTDVKRDPSHKLQSIDEMFLVLCHLRYNTLEQDLGDGYSIDSCTIPRILTSWIHFFYLDSEAATYMASLEIVNQTMPACFKANYPATPITSDCTELFIEMPSSFRAQSQTYLSYQSHNTAKGLVGPAPSGIITYISCLYSCLYEVIYPIRKQHKSVALSAFLSLVMWKWLKGALIYGTCLLQNV